MIFSSPITEIIQRRFSCRTYLEQPIAAEKQQALGEFMAKLAPGPLGSPARFALIAATEQDRKSLRGLGTYGFIRGASGFVVGAMGPGEKNLEDYGYCLEQIVLFATELELGTCWLGGTFNRSGFAKKIALSARESMPAVASIGPVGDEEGARRSLIRRQIGSDRRLAWEALFFEGQFGAGLARSKAGPYAQPLEMVRLGPSASNKQPWRVVQVDSAYHFYLARTPGYRSGLASTLLGVEDIQRVDLGIAMCHFELTAAELGLQGRWAVQDPGIARPGLTEYTVSWIQ